mmetsp:Transcript_17817/g.29784  ORF Transcript_17817/g.29784 Transcript_17817/m.29784 type:complete len:320 (+) Transcript_17817:30-989(+)
MSLTEEHVEHFATHGFVVVENVLSDEEVITARERLHESIFLQSGVEHNGENWASAGIGARLKGPGMNMYYSRWKLQNIQLNEKAVAIYQDLLKQTWGPGNIEDFEHPFGPTDERNVRVMTDRVCYRMPDCINQEGGLALHLDRNPLDPYLEHSGGIDKWRPVQGFMALTDHYDGGQGGLKVVPGFHKLVDEYFASNQSAEVRQQCVGHRGEFFRMGGKSYTKLQKQLETVYAPRGSLVLWDYRLPHATSDRLDGGDTREVVYMGFLPSTKINERFVARQREAIENNVYPDHGPKGMKRADRDWELDELTNLQRSLLGFV